MGDGAEDLRYREIRDELLGATAGERDKKMFPHDYEIEWRTKDGRNIPLSKMDDDHLKNTCRYMEKVKFLCEHNMHYRYRPTPGTMAELCYDQIEDEIVSKFMDAIINASCWITVFKKEMRKRGLKKHPKYKHKKKQQ